MINCEMEHRRHCCFFSLLFFN